MSIHQLLHGDCLELLRTLPDGSINALITDPPYCSGGRQAVGARSTISRNKRPDEDWFLSDNMGTDTYLWWMRRIALETMRVAAPGASAQVFTDWRQYTTIVTAWESAGWTLKNVVVWDKARAGALGRFWRNNHEWVAIFSKGKSVWPTGLGLFNVWSGRKPRGGAHPTEKPVQLMEFLASSVMPPGGVICDPFLGSGTTGVAAVKNGFDFIGIERDADYLAIARERIQAAAQAAANEREASCPRL